MNITKLCLIKGPQMGQIIKLPISLKCVMYFFKAKDSRTNIVTNISHYTSSCHATFLGHATAIYKN